VSWTTFLGYASGLYLLAPPMDPATLVRTVLLVHILDGIMCRVFAHNNGYPKNLWMILGLVFGVWAVAILILLPRRRTHEGRT